MNHDPFVPDGAASGVDLLRCPFCESFGVSDLHISPMQELNRHVEQAHQSDYAVVMNAVDETMAAKRRLEAQLVTDTIRERRN